MRSSSSKKEKHQHLNKYIESKILITSHELNPLLTNISSRINLFRQAKEEQLNQQYQQKFLHDRKKSATLKSKSASKIKNVGSNVSAPSTHIQNLFGQDYKDKYYAINEKYLQEKGARLEVQSKFNNVRELICEFLADPIDSKITQELITQIGSNQFERIVHKIVKDQHDYTASKISIQEIMKMLRVANLHEAIDVLKVKAEKFKNLDYCTFRILQLESSQKKNTYDSEENIKRICLGYEQQLAQQSRAHEEEIQRLQSLVQQQEKAAKKESLVHQNLQLEIQSLILSHSQNKEHIEYSFANVRRLHMLLDDLTNKFNLIEIEAEENMLKLLKSNQELLRLDRMMVELRNDLNQQIDEQQLKLQEEESFIAKLQQERVTAESKSLKAQQRCQNEKKQLQDDLVNERSKSKMIIEEKQQQLLSIQRALKMNSSSSQDLVLAIEAQAQQSMCIPELQEALASKDFLICQAQLKATQLTNQKQELQTLFKEVNFQKEQYKFLLNNARDQLSLSNQKQKEQLLDLIRQKDSQFLMSHQEILEVNLELTTANKMLKIEHQKTEIQLRETQKELTFLQRKIQTIDQALQESTKKVHSLQTDNDKLRNYLKEVESSFAEVVEIEQNSSKKAILLQQKNQTIVADYQSLRLKYQELERHNDQLIVERNIHQMQCEKLSANVQDLQKQKQRLQNTNLSLRLEGMEKNEETEKARGNVKRFEEENLALRKNQLKITAELNRVTKLMIERPQLAEIKNNLKQQLKALAALKAEWQQQALEIHLLIENTAHLIAFDLSNLLERNQSSLLDHTKPKEAITNEIVTHQPFADCLANKRKLIRLQMQSSHFSQEVLDLKIQMQILTKFVHQHIIFMLLKLDQPQIANQSNHVSEIDDQNLLEQDLNASKKSGSEKLNSRYLMSEDVISHELQLLEGQQFEAEISAVSYVLKALMNSELQVTSLPYFESIQDLYWLIQSKLVKNHLKLDLSAVEAKLHPLSSPSSGSFFHDFPLQKRHYTDPDEGKPSDRSQHLDYNYPRQERQSIKEMNEDFQLLRKRYEELKAEHQDIQKRNVELENATSVKALENTFHKLLQNLLDENVDLFEQTCRLMMKLLLFSSTEIKTFEEELGRKKKKKGGFFASIFR